MPVIGGAASNPFKMLNTGLKDIRLNLCDEEGHYFGIVKATLQKKKRKKQVRE